jgi:hypothetical protein
MSIIWIIQSLGLLQKSAINIYKVCKPSSNAFIQRCHEKYAGILDRSTRSKRELIQFYMTSAKKVVLIGFFMLLSSVKGGAQ